MLPAPVSALGANEKKLVSGALPPLLFFASSTSFFRSCVVLCDTEITKLYILCTVLISFSVTVINEIFRATKRNVCMTVGDVRRGEKREQRGRGGPGGL